MIRNLPARLLIVDDHPRAQEGLGHTLDGEHKLTVVGEVISFGEAIVLCRRLQLDLELLDLRMPDIDSITATKVITQVCPSTSVIIRTNPQNPESLVEALATGAVGYVLPAATLQQIVRAVRQVLQGKTLFM